ncbi:MAG TPA: GDSL-type esterase/lipase family protein [Abditibacteriaceae bacterium]|jgi:lysophospholipase L1-like esterase
MSPTSAPWEEQVVAIEARLPNAPAAPIVFTGSSSIALWFSLVRDFPDVPVFNAGFGGSEMSQVADRAPRIIVPLAPRKIVLFAGENDINHGVSPDEVLEHFKRFLEITAPVPVVVLSVKPSPARMPLRETMETLNSLLQSRCAIDPRLEFADLWTPMLDENGQPRRELWMRDEIHLSRAGYKLWAEILRPVL